MNCSVVFRSVPACIAKRLFVLLFRSTKRVQIRSVPFLDIPCQDNGVNYDSVAGAGDSSDDDDDDAYDNDDG